MGVKTNNEAEYEAVIFGLRKIKALLGKEKIKNTEIEFRLDSQLIARQLNGEYKIEEEKLFPLFIKIWNLKIKFGTVKFSEIPREKTRKPTGWPTRRWTEKDKIQNCFKCRKKFQ